MYNIIRIVKEKSKEHGLEYLLLNDDEDELWEIDYDKGHAINVSKYPKPDSLKHENLMRYSGTIEDFLSKEMDCKNIYFHRPTGVSAQRRIKSCSFETDD